MVPNLTPFFVDIPSIPIWIRVSIINALYLALGNATSKSNVEPKSNFRLFQSQIRQSRI